MMEIEFDYDVMARIQADFSERGIEYLNVWLGDEEVSAHLSKETLGALECAAINRYEERCEMEQSMRDDAADTYAQHLRERARGL